MRAHTFILRGAKISSLLLLGALLVSANLVLFSRPAHAESFLSQTAKCLVRTLFLSKCQKAPVTTSPPSAAPTEPATEPKQHSSSKNQKNESANSGDSQPSHSVTYAPLPTLAREDVALLPRADTIGDDAAQSTPGSYYTAEYAAFSFAPQTGQIMGAKSPVESSSEGWKVAGLTWYWWGAGIALFIGGLEYAKRRVLRHV